MAIRDQITEDMKTAMRARDSTRLITIRMLLAALKQKEIDEQVSLGDAEVLSIIDKMIKQRKDSIAQFEAGGRQDLAERERGEVELLQAYMPQPLSSAEIDELIAEAIAEIGAVGMAAMGKVMGILRPKLAGRADMNAVSAVVKAKLKG